MCRGAIGETLARLLDGPVSGETSRCTDSS
jgi:hypothetical protein